MEHDSTTMEHESTTMEHESTTMDPTTPDPSEVKRAFGMLLERFLDYYRDRDRLPELVPRLLAFLNARPKYGPGYGHL